MSLQLIENSIRSLLDKELPYLCKPRNLRVSEFSETIHITYKLDISNINGITPALKKLTANKFGLDPHQHSQTIIVDDKYLWRITLHLPINGLSISVFDAYNENCIKHVSLDIGRINTVMSRLKCNNREFSFITSHFTEDGLIWLVYRNLVKYFLILITKDFVIKRRLGFNNSFKYLTFCRENHFVMKQSELAENLRHFMSDQAGVHYYDYVSWSVIDGLAIVIARPLSLHQNVALYDGEVFKQLKIHMESAGYIFKRGDGKIFINNYRGNEIYEFV